MICLRCASGLEFDAKDAKDRFEYLPIATVASLRLIRQLHAGAVLPVRTPNRKNFQVSSMQSIVQIVARSIAQQFEYLQ